MIQMPIAFNYEVQRIAIVDDDPREAKTAEMEVEAAGFEPFIVKGPIHEIKDVTKIILSNAQGVLCDHRLMPYGYAKFYGAKLVAHLYDLKVPAILITQYADIDDGMSIRRWRDKVPILLSRDEADADRIKSGMDFCLRELYDQVASTRKPHRVLLRIVDLGKESNEKVVDVIIPSWNPHKAVRFPALLLPKSIGKSHMKIGTRLFANVNIGAEKASELYFKDFELATELDADDELS